MTDLDPTSASDAPLNFSLSLENTLNLAVQLAADRRHEFATLEHLLAALCEDEAAVEALTACDADVDRIRTACIQYLDMELKSLVLDKSIETVEPKPTAGFQRVVQRASIHCRSSGRAEVASLNVLVALFSEREAHATFFLQEQDVTRYDVVRFITQGLGKGASKIAIDVERLKDAIQATTEQAPEFVVIQERLAYVQRAPRGAFKDRLAAAKERCTAARALCSRRGNSEPLIDTGVGNYAAKLEHLRPKSGLYAVLLAGLELEALTRIRQAMKADEDHPAMDMEVAFSLQALLIAHAGLMALFPEAENNYQEIDRIRSQGADFSTLRDLTESVLSSLAKAESVLSADTQRITAQLSQPVAPIVGGEISGIVSARHGWLRGALSSMGRFLLGQVVSVIKVARDTGIREAIIGYLHSHGGLTTAVALWLASNREALIALSNTLIASFGWVKAFLHLIGL